MAATTTSTISGEEKACRSLPSNLSTIRRVPPGGRERSGRDGCNDTRLNGE